MEDLANSIPECSDPLWDCAEILYQFTSSSSSVESLRFLSEIWRRKPTPPRSSSSLVTQEDRKKIDEFIQVTNERSEDVRSLLPYYYRQPDFWTEAMKEMKKLGPMVERSPKFLGNDPNPEFGVSQEDFKRCQQTYHLWSKVLPAEEVVKSVGHVCSEEENLDTEECVKLTRGMIQSQLLLAKWAVVHCFMTAENQSNNQQEKRS